MFTESVVRITAHGHAIEKHRLKVDKCEVSANMWTKLTDVEALTICNQIRDRLMKEKRSLDQRIKEDTAIAQVMNLAQETLKRRSENNE